MGFKEYISEVQKNGKEIVKTGRKIDGFVWEDSKGQFWYAFGKPSQGNYIGFASRSKEEAIKKIKSLSTNAKEMFK